MQMQQIARRFLAMASATAAATPKRQPCLFIPHGGGPWPFMDLPPHLDHGPNLRPFLENIRNELPEPPKAILVISAHWEESAPTILDPRGASHSLLYDYYGFPPQTYEITYPAPTAPNLTQIISSLLSSSGYDIVQTESNRGIDHGVFVPLKLIYPDADIPIAQLSLLSSLDAEEHIKLGESIAPLRDEGVLILGSGMSYHNLGKLLGGRDGEDSFSSDAFNDWLAETVISEPEVMRHRLIHWEDAPGAKDAHPREEHLLPLMVCAGAATTAEGNEEEKGEVIFSDRIMGAQVSAVQFG